MKTEKFITLFKKAFGENQELPIAFWYDDEVLTIPEKQGGCMFKYLPAVREGASLSLGVDTIACGGGKFYSGFADMPEHVPNFVSNKEHYKKSPQCVLDYVHQLGVKRTSKSYLNLARIDKIPSFEKVEGILFFVTPDVLTGLYSWAFYDTNAMDAVATGFNSGCSAMFTNTLNENAAGGYRCFLGMFDPSVRPYIGANELGFAIPTSRFKVMCETLESSCLMDTRAWNIVKARIEENR